MKGSGCAKAAAAARQEPRHEPAIAHRSRVANSPHSPLTRTRLHGCSSWLCRSWAPTAVPGPGSRRAHPRAARPA